MKITLTTDCGQTLSINSDSGFQVYVDGELLLDHCGINQPDNKSTKNAEWKADMKVRMDDEIAEAEKSLAHAFADYHKRNEDPIAREKSLKYYDDSLYPKTSAASTLFPERCGANCVCHTRNRNITFQVPSSSFIDVIRWFAHDEAIGEDALEVRLKDGRIVNYAGVPYYIVDNWIFAIKSGESAGRFYNSNIKGQYNLVSTIGDIYL